MMMALVVVCALCAVVPAALFVANLKPFVAPPVADGGARVAVLIPARNEEANIAECLGCVLASRDVVLEVVVLDDASTDATAAIVAGVMERDARVRLVQSAALPAGWNGKQHACWQLAESCVAPVMLFLDADVRVTPDAVARMAAFQRVSGAALVSGFPRLVCVGFLEKLLLPLIHFVLLGFLPVARMRATSDAAFSAAVGSSCCVSERLILRAAGMGRCGLRCTMG